MIIHGLGCYEAVTNGEFMELKTFGERLFWARRSYAKITQQELRDKMSAAYGIDIGRNYISQIETDEGAKPAFEVARAMAGTLGISLDFLAGFTENHVPAQGEETTPNYFSAEADEVAQLVDAMLPEQRLVVLNVARTIVSPTTRQRDRALARDVLDSVEQQLGRGVRLDLEKFMRDKGLTVDPNP
jgi:transcriptional regulator with XRE-family HTH domain